jgi:RNA polymerase sigma factor (sigma-70 family)
MPKVNLTDSTGQIQRFFGEETLAGLTDAQLLQRHAAYGDELAFKGLIQRHGPMVLAVCRGILNDSNDADDAFQAVFLLLARKARSIWINDSLGGWLHRVACRIALQVKAESLRRRTQERRAAEHAAAAKELGTPWDDTRAVVHEEIDRLPHRYREPIVLCYLEQMTYEQAARKLSWSEATTQGRLARGRNLLRTRLARRGVTAGTAALTSLVASQEASAVSLALVENLLKWAPSFVARKAMKTSAISVGAKLIVNQALRSMLITKLVNVGVAALVFGTLTAAVATGLIARGRITKVGSEPTQPSQPQAASSPSTVTDPATKQPPSVADNRSARSRSQSPSQSARAGLNNKLLPGLRGPELKPSSSSAKKNASSSPPTGAPASSGLSLSKDLSPGRRMDRGDSLFSPLGGFRLTLQQDGDLALYAIDDSHVSVDVRSIVMHKPEAMHLYTNRIWSARTNVTTANSGPGWYCVMHADGNFVVYDRADRVCLESGTHGNPGSFLRCQDDGNLVIYTPELQPIWTSGTHARERSTEETSEPEPAEGGKRGAAGFNGGTPSQ